MKVFDREKFVQPSQGADGIVCFSHLRWDFVHQRPQHLMTRFSSRFPILYFEEATDSGEGEPGIKLRKQPGCEVWVAVPTIPTRMSPGERDNVLADLLENCICELGMQRPIFWFYTPMMLHLAARQNPSAIIYDCMDELANFDFAPSELPALEQKLLSLADVVFAGGQSLFNAKLGRHDNVHLFPSAVDRKHFEQARRPGADHNDQRALPYPRLGFFGVVDERFDGALLSAAARAHPEWSIVVVGPVVKIDPATLPGEGNIHYLGGKAYGDLPSFLGGWDVALMPFAINAATRFISPTKTPEYLAGGKPVVSTPIQDVVSRYGGLETVFIANGSDSFIRACEDALSLNNAGNLDFTATDMMLSAMSWDTTFEKMLLLVEEAVSQRHTKQAFQKSAFIQRQTFDALVVGAGFAGAVMAERLAAGSGKRVLVIDRRSHIAGNAYDYHDQAGVQVHAYGPHIFHTNSSEIVKYLSRFTSWRPYEHRVLACVGDRLVPIPINRRTLNEIFGLSLKSDEDTKRYLESRAEPRVPIETSEDVVINAVGRELYEMFFRGYTRKQWGLDPSELDRSVTARIPTRTSLDDRYFTDVFQSMPSDGYTAMFENMLAHPNITVELDTDYDDIRTTIRPDLTVYTGPIDAYFGFKYGTLPYRSLRFEHRTLDCREHQSVGTINYPAEQTPYTRISEFKHLTGQQHSKTSVVYEFPSAVGDPYYPIPQAKNEAIYKQYSRLADLEPTTLFVGRLATYRYFNMDQVVGQALATYRRFVSTRLGLVANGNEVIAAQ